MAHFPKDIVADILSRLPVEPLLRFRCVSKPWCALIDSPDFTKLHLKRSIETKNNRSLILRDQSQHLYSVSLYALDVAVEVDHPLQKCNEFGPEVLGSCNGLVLLHDSDTGDVAIWNPSTRKSLKLPSTGMLPLSFSILVAHGLGYDSVNDDYKVLKMTQFYGKNTTPRCEVKVYGLKSNSWKKMKDFPYCLPYDGYCCGMYASGALHWAVSTNGEARHGSSVAAVDLATEKYRLLPLPDFDDKKKPDIAVVAFEGCLGLLCNFLSSHFDVWVLKDNGVGESWTKLLCIAQPQHIRSFKSVVPLAFSKDGTKVLLGQDSQKLIWFDLKLNVVKTVEVRGLPRMFHEELCVQSLVSLGRGGESYGKKQPKEKAKGKKPESYGNKQPKEETKEKNPDKTGTKRDGFLSVGFKLKL